MPTAPHFSPALFDFLRKLSRNNKREWFQANKQTYERDVRDPLLRFIADFAPHLKRISPRFVADPRPVGGSMFRIYRDTRFSRDKRPYKTVASAQFRHENGKDVHAPGFYLHLEPGNVFAGVGLWHPDGPTLRAVRDAIVDAPDKWKRAKTAKAFRARFDLAGESLKRPPRGYDPDHPLVEDLRRRDFVAFASFNDNEVFRADFLRRYADTARKAKLFMAFLTKSVGLAW
jgi:uncharacterized protein (TIGR02453 family)